MRSFSLNFIFASTFHYTVDNLVLPLFTANKERTTKIVVRSLFKMNYLSEIEAIPGNSLPSRYSSEAPPPVEMCVNWSAIPSC